MANQLDFVTALRFIPEFTGGSETDLASFISKCDFVFSKIPELFKSDILAAVLTQLKGKAFDAVRYREITTWDELKLHLRTIFGTSHSVQYLQGELSSMKQGPTEDIKNFAQRIEKTYHELTHALTVGKTSAEAKIIAQTVQSHALSVFTSGVNQSIQIILLARNINNFEEAVLLAMEQEKFFRPADVNNRKTDKNKFKSNFKNNSFARTGDKPNKDKSTIKCYRCDKMGHYANECRTPEQYITKKPEIKKEYSGQVKFCKYCKLKNHDISECRKLKKQTEGDTSAGTSTEDRAIGEIKNNVRVITPIKAEHIYCRSEAFIQGENQFLIDSGADMNLIKMSILKDHIRVNEKEKRNIKGISTTTILTVGTVIITVFIKDKIFEIKFDIVSDDFPIPEAGILGIAFLKSNKVIIDMEKEILIIPDPIVKNTVESIVIPARSNCVLQVRADELINHKVVAIRKHALNEDVIIANSLSPVKNNKIISNIINISEQPFLIDELTSSHLKWEPYTENIFFIENNARSNKSNQSRIKLLNETIKTDHLNNEEKQNIISICNEFSDIFYLEGDLLTATDVVTHKINTPRLTKAINIRPYRIPWAYQAEIEKQIIEMKEDNIIRNSVSPFNFPLVVVKKKTGEDGQQKLRVCVDFRKLNEVTDNEAYCLPNLLDILESLGSSKYFSTLDLASGYHQVKIDEGDIHKTAFSTKSGHYEFLRMPFGLSSAPATFTRAMKSILMGLEEMCTAYLDDIVVHGSSLNDHGNKLIEVFKRLRTHKLKLQPRKCAFLRKEVLYLGHVINETGVSPDPNKLKCIKEYPKLKNAKDIKSFLGLLNYYRRFVDNFAKIAKPLTNLLKKDVPFVWTDMCEHAFEELKRVLTNPPLLIYPDWSKGNFNLMTDASQYAIGGVLSQGDIGADRPIAYASRTLNKAEINYSVIQKELLAIVWAVKYFRPYLYGQKFKIITDHRPLTYLFNIKDASSQLMRWRLQLEEYDYEIIYRAGSLHSNADCLSRIHLITDNDEQQKYQAFIQYKNEKLIFNSKIIEVANSIQNAEITENLILPLSGDLIITHVGLREILTKNGITTKNHFEDGNKFVKIDNNNRFIILYKLKDTHLTKLSGEQLFQAISEIKTFCIDHEIMSFSIIRFDGFTTLTNFESVRTMFRYIFKDTDILVTIYTEQNWSNEEKEQIIYEYHNTPLGGHSGVSRTVNRLQMNYRWKHLKKDVKKYIKNCDVCQKNKSHIKTKQPMIITSTVTKTFERICLDIVGPLPPTTGGNTYILTLQDELSRYGLAVALVTTDASTVARAFVEHFVCIFGIPASILTDCGTNFLSDIFKSMCKLLDIEKSKTTPWHPQTNGFLERSHKTLKIYLRSFIDKDNNWDRLLAYAMFCYNTTVHTSTAYTPYELVFGRKPNIPSAFYREPEAQYNYENYVIDLKRIMQEANQIARTNLISKKESNKNYYDKNAHAINIKMGDKVLIKEHNKRNTLSRNWTGPYEVIEVHDNENITVNKSRKGYRIHKNNVKIFYETEL